MPVALALCCSAAQVLHNGTGRGRYLGCECFPASCEIKHISRGIDHCQSALHLKRGDNVLLNQLLPALQLYSSYDRKVSATCLPGSISISPLNPLHGVPRCYLHPGASTSWAHRPQGPKHLSCCLKHLAKAMGIGDAISLEALREMKKNTGFVFLYCKEGVAASLLQ